MALDQIRKSPSASDFCDPLPRLIDAGVTDLPGSIRRFGEIAGAGQRQPVSVGFHLIGDTARYWLLQIGPQGPTVSEEDPDDTTRSAPDIEVVTTEQTWLEIARGTLAPLSAVFAGRLRFRGDVPLARRVVRQLRR